MLETREIKYISDVLVVITLVACSDQNEALVDTHIRYELLVEAESREAENRSTINSI